MFDNLKEGYFEIVVEAEGYLTATKYISVSKSNPIELTITLKPFESTTDTIEVNSKYFKKDDRSSTGFINVSFDELKKTPGTIDDIIRHFESSPGVAIGNDMANDYMVRGGAAIENQVIIDNIELQSEPFFTSRYK